MAPKTALCLHQHIFSPSSQRQTRREYSSEPLSSRAPDTSREPDLVRALMRRVPHPVAIVTSSDTTHPKTFSVSSGGKMKPHPTDSSETYRGATISSFVTVALTPVPIVCFNITHRSSTYHAIKSSGMFRTHLMNECDEAKTIASRFAGGNAGEPFHGIKGKLEDWVSTRKSEGKLVDRSNPPIIGGQTEGGKETVAFWVRCKYLSDKTVELGDHVVLFGEVVEVGGSDRGEVFKALFEAGSPDPVEVKDKDSCMVYFDGKYSSIES